MGTVLCCCTWYYRNKACADNKNEFKVRTTKIHEYTALEKLLQQLLTGLKP